MKKGSEEKKEKTSSPNFREKFSQEYYHFQQRSGCTKELKMETRDFILLGKIKKEYPDLILDMIELFFVAVSEKAFEYRWITDPDVKSFYYKREDLATRVRKHREQFPEGTDLSEF